MAVRGASARQFSPLRQHPSRAVRSGRRRCRIRGSEGARPTPDRRPRAVSVPSRNDPIFTCGASSRPTIVGPLLLHHAHRIRAGDAQLGCELDERIVQRNREVIARSSLAHRAVGDTELPFGFDSVGHDTRGRQQGLTGWQLAYQCVGARRVELAEHIVEQQHGRRAGELRGHVVPGESQRERERTLLALRRVRSRIELVQLKMQLVAMGTDEREAAIDLALAVRRRAPLASCRRRRRRCRSRSVRPTIPLRSAR